LVSRPAARLSWLLDADTIHHRGPANEFVFFKDVPRPLAAKLLGHLNLVGEHGLAAQDAAALAELTAAQAMAADDAAVERRFHHHLAASAEGFVAAAGDDRRSLGYVTQDSCAGLGDDVLHRPVPSEWQPTFVATELAGGEGEGEGKDAVDVVFFDFLIPDLVSAMNAVQSARVYSSGDVRVYLQDLKANNLVAEYAKRRW